MSADGGLEDGKRTGCEFVLFDAGDFVFAGMVLVMTENGATDGIKTYVSSLRGFWSSSLQRHVSLGRNLRDAAHERIRNLGVFRHDGVRAWGLDDQKVLQRCGDKVIQAGVVIDEIVCDGMKLDMQLVQRLVLDYARISRAHAVARVAWRRYEVITVMGNARMLVTARYACRNTSNVPASPSAIHFVFDDLDPTSVFFTP